ncbi:Dynein light chain LC6, flagellar outer arm [Glycine soja]|nr:hypothetical protein JHK85_035354 [Glycine max]KAH1222753.1 Dynein light chain LC6, flagellar outer arm [Glycine max]KHN28015.1 Dynein light chain LC6, flagellar outer arm [Glycine soja]
MLEGKAVIGETDMLQTMQQDALNLASKALDFFDVTEATDIARFIKKASKYLQSPSVEFDRTHGPGWQCIVGTDFGSFVTHCCGCFIYFCIGSLAILLFRGSPPP